MGSRLEQQTKVEPILPLWSAAYNHTHPKDVKKIHAEYIAAGADICTTNTYRTLPGIYAKAGRSHAEAYESFSHAIDAVYQAIKEADRKVYIAGSSATFEDCYKPGRTVSDQFLADQHGTHMQWLADAHVDCILLETVPCARELKIMTSAVRSVGKPFIVSVTVDENGNLRDGTPIAEAVRITDDSNRVAISINCSPILHADNAFNKLKSEYGGPIGVYPNGLKEDEILGIDDACWPFEKCHHGGHFVGAGLAWAQAGAQIVGGCCGVGPEDIAALRVALSKQFGIASIESAGRMIAPALAAHALHYDHTHHHVFGG